MMDDRKVLGQLLAALLIGLTGVVGILLLLSHGASAGPMLEQAGLSISKGEIANPIQVVAQVEVLSLKLTESDDPDLEVTKSASSDPVTAGEVLTYTLVITNNGPYSGTGVLVTDTLPTGVTFTTATASKGGCNESSGTVTCTLNTLVVSDTATVTIVVTVNSSTTGPLTNMAEVSGNEPDLTPGNNTATEETTVNTQADLVLTKTDAPDPVIAGETLTYTLTITNNGPSDATGVVVTDTLNPNLDYASASPGPTGFSNGDPYWSLAPLKPGDSGQIILNVQVHTPLPNQTILTNTAWLDADQTTPLSITEETTVHSSPVMTITKTDYPDPVDANGILRYTLVITNSGNENATPVTVTEHYDPNVSFFSSVPNPDDLGSGNRIWTFTTLDVD